MEMVAGGRVWGRLEELALAVNRGFQRASPAAAVSMEAKEPQNIEQGMSKEEGGGNRREFSFAVRYSLFDILRFMDFGNSHLSLVICHWRRARRGGRRLAGSWILWPPL